MAYVTVLGYVVEVTQDNGESHERIELTFQELEPALRMFNGLTTPLRRGSMNLCAEVHDPNADRDRSRVILEQWCDDHG